MHSPRSVHPSFQTKPYFSFKTLFSPLETIHQKRTLNLFQRTVKPHLRKRMSVDVEDVSTEELRNRIQKFYDGDFEAVPSIMEVILARRLLRKHAESEDELNY